MACAWDERACPQARRYLLLRFSQRPHVFLIDSTLSLERIRVTCNREQGCRAVSRGVGESYENGGTSADATDSFQSPERPLLLCLLCCHPEVLTHVALPASFRPPGGLVTHTESNVIMLWIGRGAGKVKRRMKETRGGEGRGGAGASRGRPCGRHRLAPRATKCHCRASSSAPSLAGKLPRWSVMLRTLCHLRAHRAPPGPRRRRRRPRRPLLRRPWR